MSLLANYAGSNVWWWTVGRRKRYYNKLKPYSIQVEVEGSLQCRYDTTCNKNKTFLKAEEVRETTTMDEKDTHPCHRPPISRIFRRPEVNVLIRVTNNLHKKKSWPG